MTSREFVDAIQSGQFRQPFKHREPDQRALLDADGKLIAEFTTPEALHRFITRASTEIRIRMWARQPYTGK